MPPISNRIRLALQKTVVPTTQLGNSWRGPSHGAFHTISKKLNERISDPMNTPIP